MQDIQIYFILLLKYIIKRQFDSFHCVNLKHGFLSYVNKTD
jgi:hypothetical protein